MNIRPANGKDYVYCESCLNLEIPFECQGCDAGSNYSGADPDELDAAPAEAPLTFMPIQDEQ
ncbi:hypothetical protein [Duganella sp. FT27W]|uniref:hypothetical protein n=1 Tax=Duganella sp. FT27W TaxID=2654636 RepID=UPI00128D6A11|nr:hypothetical protein [Duganella sp. FT27W]MPQ56286.1 hypothetical protein [Duganella sp. FT27W]